MNHVEFYFDPICPWCWITSRWLVEVQALRPVDVDWRSFSLKLKNEGSTDDPRPSHVRGLESLRVSEAVHDAVGGEAVADLYTEYGRRIHHDGQLHEFGFEDVLESAGLDPAFATAASDESWDRVIRSSMDRALELAGDDVGVPLLVFTDGAPGAVFGPVISPAPTGEAASALFDRVKELAELPGFWELKRTRTKGPQFGPRP